MKPEQAENAVALLERVASGAATAAEALQKWPQNTEDSLINVSWHDLSHFAADADIRDRDPRYREYQVSLLLRRADEIRQRYGLRK